MKIDLDKIILRLSNDDDSSIEELFNYYYPRLYSFSKSFLKIETHIDDILQEVFVRIWQNRKKINSSSTFNSFIFTTTKNLLLNELRSQLNNDKLKDKVKDLSVAPEYSLLEQIHFNDLQEKVNDVIAELPDRQKEVFTLSRHEGLSHKEIAEKLKISTKTVEHHITQAAKHLKNKLKALGFLPLLYFYLFL